MSDSDTAAAVIARLEAPTPEGWRMAAYYYGFAGTGVIAIDRVLSAVACAGKAYHYTSEWNDDCDAWHDGLRGTSPVNWIECAADDAAADIRALIESHKAQAARIAMWEATAPTAEYSTLRAAFNAQAARIAALEAALAELACNCRNTVGYCMKGKGHDYAKCGFARARALLQETTNV